MNVLTNSTETEPRSASDVSEIQQKLQVTFQNPEPNYYDGKFATQFENCIKDKFIGLDHINEYPSDYVKQRLMEVAWFLESSS